MITLRDGTTAEDGRLGRLVQFDERSRAYPIRAMVGDKPPRSYTWSVGAWLNQLSEGSCVGHAWAHELCARPLVRLTDHEQARQIYFDAQKIDPWPGGSYEGASPQYEGTSILAGAKVCQDLGHFDEYRWSFSLSDLVLALGYAGPAVLGVNWYEDMANPDPDGWIKPSGRLLGGHAILAFRVWVKTRLRETPEIWLWNSWGRSWGTNGCCRITFSDLEKLLNENGEACIPVSRKRVV